MRDSIPLVRRTMRWPAAFRRPHVSVDEPLTTNAEANAAHADVYAALTRKWAISVNACRRLHLRGVRNTNYGAYPYEDADSARLSLPRLTRILLRMASVNRLNICTMSFRGMRLLRRSVQMSRGGKDRGLMLGMTEPVLAASDVEPAVLMCYRTYRRPR